MGQTVVISLAHSLRKLKKKDSYMKKNILNKVISIIDIAENIERSIPAFAKRLAPDLVSRAEYLIDELKVLKTMIEGECDGE